MNKEMKVLLTTERPIFDVNDQWLPQGTYSFDIIRFTQKNSVQGRITSSLYNDSSNDINGVFEFKSFSVIKMMSKAQSFLSRKSSIQYPIDITQYPSPSNSPISFSENTFVKKKSPLSKEHINNVHIPEKIYQLRFPKKSPPPVHECTICLELCQVDVNQPNNIKALPCGHVFHKQCIRKWIKSSNHDNCPNCRNKLNEEEKKELNRTMSMTGDTTSTTFSLV